MFHDVRWPGRRRANLDHVVVGPSGVFVVDTKNWSGRIEVRVGVLRQDGRSREKAVTGVADAARARPTGCPRSTRRTCTPCSASSPTSR